MKHLLVGLSLVLGIMFITPAPAAHAWSWSSFFKSWSGDSNGKKSDRPNRRYKWGYGSKKDGSSGNSVPELDPSVAGSAMVLLLGGVAYVMSRRRDDELA